jgi:hypothetical protein
LYGASRGDAASTTADATLSNTRQPTAIPGRGPEAGPTLAELGASARDRHSRHTQDARRLPAKRAPSGIPGGDEIPPWTLAVAEVRPRGLDRQGRGRPVKTGPPPR